MYFSTWETVEVGNIKGDFLKALVALKRAGVSYDVDETAFRTSLIDYELSPRRINLVLASPRKLGVTRQIRSDAIRHKAAVFGLSLCPAETALARLLQEPNLIVPAMRRSIFSGGQNLEVMMEPVRIHGINPMWFTVGNHRLSVAYRSHYDIHDEDPLVFVRN